MIYCEKCGKEIAIASNFCEHCGEKVTREQPLNDNKMTKTINKESQHSSEFSPDLTQNDKVKAAEEMFRGYWKFLINTLKNPMISFDLESSNNGMIQIIILSLFSLLALDPIARGIFRIYTLGTQVSFSLFLLFLIFYAFTFWFNYFVLSFLTPEKVILKQTFSQYGGLLSLNVFLLVISSISGLISTVFTSLLALILFFSSFVLHLFAFNFILYKKVDNPKWNITYVLLICNVIIVLIVGTPLALQIRSILDRISGTFWW